MALLDGADASAERVPDAADAERGADAGADHAPADQGAEPGAEPGAESTAPSSAASATSAASPARHLTIITVLKRNAILAKRTCGLARSPMC